MNEVVVTGANVVVLAAIAWMLWRQQRALKKFYWPTLMLKIGAGIALGIVYTYYYDVSDSLGYFEDGTKLSNLARQDFRNYLRFFTEAGESFPFWNRLNFQDPRALFLSKITSVFCLLTHDNYWLISCYYSFIGFIGAWYLVQMVRRLDYHLSFPAIVAFLLMPSIVFWTSGLMKETLAMASMYFMVVVFLKLWTKERVKRWQWILLFFAWWLLWGLKYYYLATILPVLTTALVFRWFVFPYFKIANRFYYLLLWLVVFAIPLFFIGMIHPNFYPERILSVIVENYKAFEKLSAPGDMVHYPNLEPTVRSLLVNVPQALFAGLFRPMPWESDVIFKMLMSIENVVLLLLTAMALLQWKDAIRSRHRFLIFSVLVHVVMLAVFLALSTPNFGTLVRYRVGFLPFFVLIITACNPIVLRVSNFLERRFSALEG